MITDMAAFIEQAWTDHVRDEAGVAARIEGAVAQLAQAPSQVAAFTQLAEHVLVGHRGDAEAMARCAAALEPLAADDAAREAVHRSQLAAALLQGDGVALSNQLPAAAVVRAHGSAVCGLAARGDAEGARQRWEAAAARALGDGAALKAYAACCHNLALALEEKPPRSAALDTLMMDAAQRSRSTWSQAGTWLHVERADHMLSRCAAAIGDAAQAHAHATSCLAICEANGAEPIEHFFAHEAIARACRLSGDLAAARAHRDTMRKLLDGIAGDGLHAWAQESFDTLARALDG